jgi:hypothetical protein
VSKQITDWVRPGSRMATDEAYAFSYIGIYGYRPRR